MVSLFIPLRILLSLGCISVYPPEYPLHGGVQRLHGEGSLLHCRYDLPVIHAVGAGHLQVETCSQALDPVVHCSPVAHHHAVESPLISQYIREIGLVLRGMQSVDPVIRAHDSPGLRVLHCSFEGREIYLPQCTLIYLRALGQSPRLLIVCQEMLYGHSDILALHALDICSRHLCCQQRILRKILEVPAAQRRSLDVYRRTQDGGDVLRLTLVAQSLAHLVHQGSVEGCGCRTCSREADRLYALEGSQMILVILRLGSLPQAVRAVAHHYLRYLFTFYFLGMPEIPAGAQGCFFL